MCGDPKLASVSRTVWEARKNDSAIVCKAGSGPATGRRRLGSAPFSRAGFGSRSTSLEKTHVSLRTMKNALMADILNVPAKKVEEVTARSGSKHRISVEVLDHARPRRTRWSVRFENQQAAGFAALKVFTDRPRSAFNCVEQRSQYCHSLLRARNPPTRYPLSS